MNGAELLREFRERRSEQAFAELARRYTNLVFSVAKRRLNNAALAEEAAQSVFLRLAKAAPDLPSEGAFLGWLHRTSVHVSVDLWRAESRRRVREEKAVAMQLSEGNETESELSAEVDEALNELAEADRLALLLRFFDGRKMRELGESLGISEDAAKMRVSRSLERLRERLVERGIQTSAMALGVFLGEQAVVAAPATLVGSIISAVGVGVGASGGWLPGLSLKFLGAVAVGVALVGLVAVKHGNNGKSGNSGNAQTGTAGTVSGAGSVEAANLPASAANVEAPDPRELLEGVARARNRIFSGNIEFETVIFERRSGALPKFPKRINFVRWSCLMAINVGPSRSGMSMLMSVLARLASVRRRR